MSVRPSFGKSSRRGGHHVVVSTFDEHTGRQIDDASVEASIAPPGPEEARCRIEPMQIAYAMSHGNFFTSTDHA